jgi:hypothetical protein
VDQQRVDEDEPGHGQGEDAHARRRPPHRRAQQGEPGHGHRPQYRRLPTGEDAEEHQDGQPAGEAATEAQSPEERSEQGQDERHVLTGECSLNM